MKFFGRIEICVILMLALLFGMGSRSTSFCHFTWSMAGRWLLGLGVQVSFLQDNFMGKLLMEYFGLHGNMAALLSG